MPKAPARVTIGGLCVTPSRETSSLLCPFSSFHGLLSLLQFGTGGTTLPVLLTLVVTGVPPKQHEVLVSLPKQQLKSWERRGIPHMFRLGCSSGMNPLGAK